MKVTAPRPVHRNGVGFERGFLEVCDGAARQLASDREFSAGTVVADMTGGSRPGDKIDGSTVLAQNAHTNWHGRLPRKGHAIPELPVQHDDRS